MRRTILLSLLALALASCGGGSEGSQASESAAPTASSTAPMPVPAGTLAFSSAVTGKRDIYLIQTDGSQLQRLTKSPAFEEYPAWSPDGAKIAYQSRPGLDSPATIWVMDADGSHRVQLTEYPLNAGWPTWSPDGTQIAFGNMDPGSSESNIYVMGADGSHPRRVTKGPESDMFPRWAPDGRLYFLRKPTVEWYGDVYSVDLDGRGLAQITTTGQVAGFGLSPDGTKLALFDSECSCIAIVPTDGSGDPQELAALPYGPFVNAAWAPDGTVMAVANADEAEISGGSELSILGSEGAGLVTVPNVEKAFDPAWRPT